MKKICALIILLVLVGMPTLSLAGPNTFPSSGAVGVGTTTPSFDLHIWDTLSSAELGLRTDATGGGGGRAVIGVRHSDQNYYSGHVYIAPYMYNGSSYFYNTDTLVVDGAGVGIGTRTPEGNLHVYDAEEEAEIVLQTSATGDGGGRGIIGVRHSDQNYYSGQVFIAPYKATGGSPSYAYDTNMLVVDPNGVGIGTSNPQSELAVNGTITAKEIQVTTTGWADYVFHEDYELMSLDSISEFIKKNGHLPNIPSEKEALEDGINVSEMTVKLLEKVEELTLHVIALNKENKVLGEKLASHSAAKMEK